MYGPPPNNLRALNKLFEGSQLNPDGISISVSISTLQANSKVLEIRYP